MKKETFERAMLDIDDDLLDEVGQLRFDQFAAEEAAASAAPAAASLTEPSTAATAEATEADANATVAAAADKTAVPSKVAETPSETRKKGRNRSGSSGSRAGVIGSVALIAAGLVAMIAIVSVVRHRNRIRTPAGETDIPSYVTADPLAALPDITDFSLWPSYHSVDSGSSMLPEQEASGWSDFLLREEEYDLTKAEEAAYHARLEAAGFTVEKEKYGAFIYSDSAYIFQTGTASANTGESEKTRIELVCFERSPSHSGSVSEEEAADIISVAPDWDHKPLDVTPRDLFEETGIQVFLAPYRYTIPDAQDGVDREYVSTRFCYIYGGKIIHDDVYPALSMIAAADIDNDGTREVVMLSFEPLAVSSVSSFSAEVFRQGHLVYKSTFTSRDYWNFSLVRDEGGCLKVLLRDYLTYPDVPAESYNRTTREESLSIGLSEGELVLSDGIRLYRNGDLVPFRENGQSVPPEGATASPTLTPTEYPTESGTRKPSPTETPEPTAPATAPQLPTATAGIIDSPYTRIDEITFTGQVIVDDDSIYAAIESISLDKLGAYQLKVYVENRTNQKMLDVDVNNFVVNGLYMRIDRRLNYYEATRRAYLYLTISECESLELLKENGMADPTLISMEMVFSVGSGNGKYTETARKQVAVCPLGPDNIRVYDFTKKDRLETLADNDYFALYLYRIASRSYTGDHIVTPVMYMFFVNKTGGGLVISGEDLTVNGIRLFEGSDMDLQTSPTLFCEYPAGALNVWELTWALYPALQELGDRVQADAFREFHTVQFDLVVCDRYHLTDHEELFRQTVTVDLDEFFRY